VPEPAKKSIDLWCPSCKKEIHFGSDAEEYICSCGKDLGRVYDVADLLDDAEAVRSRRKEPEKPQRKKGIFG
jgi:hypothetical protein